MASYLLLLHLAYLVASVQKTSSRKGCENPYTTYIIHLHLHLLPDILALRLLGKLEKDIKGCRTRDNQGKSEMEVEYNSQEK